MIKKLLNVQSALKAPKNQRNAFGNYNYRSCEDILEAVKPLLAQQGLVLTITDSIEMVGTRVYVKATATVTDGEKSISTEAFAREADGRKGMDESQVTGSASSYARKYALNGLFCIDDTKDADTMKPEEAPKQAQKPQAAPKAKANPKTNPKAAGKNEMLKAVADKAKSQHISPDDIKEVMKRKYGKATSSELTDAEAADLEKNIIDYALEIIEDEAALVDGI